MDEAVEELYRAFAHYRIGDDFTGCSHCVDPRQATKLATTSLRQLTFSDLESYSAKALTTWGVVRHFKHFLPRLLELTIEHRDEFLDLAVVFGKLSTAAWESWPKRERVAIERFLNKYWQYQLAEPIVGTFHDSIDTVLCAIASAVSSVQSFLDQWLATRSKNSKKHLAAFILQNEAQLLKNERLANPFWNTSGATHGQVLRWLQSDEVFNYFDGPNDSMLVKDFSYAWPQLIAIRARLANNVP